MARKVAFRPSRPGHSAVRCASGVFTGMGKTVRAAWQARCKPFFARFAGNGFGQVNCIIPQYFYYVMSL
ncbi:MAG: hypothetical protein J5654_08090 [Victivallales bacterium]|nr:hypothetical protein [Victivallales bacterium]